MVKQERKIKMLCPICKSELVVGEGFVHEDVMGPHPSTKYHCPNHKGIFWGSDGDLFVEDYSTYKRVNYPFINELTSAFGSFSRKAEVECYKHDEDKNFTLIPNLLKIEFYVTYKADEDGNILFRRWHHRLWKKDDGLSGYVWWTPPIVNLFRLIGKVHTGVFHCLMRDLNPYMMNLYFGWDVWEHEKRRVYRFYRWYGKLWWKILHGKDAPFTEEYALIAYKDVLDSRKRQMALKMEGE